MANLADKSGDAYSNLVNGRGTNSLTFTMPGAISLDVESVVATVDNTAGGDATATLTIRDPSGQVIATKRQGEVIPAGDSGTATFALRLDDSETGGIRYNVANSGGFLRIAATGNSPVAYQVGSQTSTWSVGISGDTVAIGADTNLFLTAVGAAEIIATAAVDIFTDGPLIVGADRSTQTYGGAVTFNVGDSFAVQATNDVSIAGAGQEIDLSASEVAVRLATGDALTVYDHNNNPIFRVNENGDLQGLTGKALAFNL